MRVHEVAVDGYQIEPKRLTLGTEGSYGNEALRLTLSEDWDGLAVTVAFTNADSTTVVVPTDGVVGVPAEATAKACAVGHIVVAGVEDGRCVITADMLYRVAPHAPAQGEAAQATPSEYEQWLANIQGVETDMKAWVEKTLSDFTVEKLDIDTATDSEIAAIFDGDSGKEHHFVDVPRLATFKTLQDAANLDLYPSDAVTAAQIDSYFA